GGYSLQTTRQNKIGQREANPTENNGHDERRNQEGYDPLLRRRLRFWGAFRRLFFRWIFISHGRVSFDGLLLDQLIYRLQQLVAGRNDLRCGIETVLGDDHVTEFRG